MAYKDMEEVLVAESARAISTLFRDMGNIFELAVPASVDKTDIEVPVFRRATDLSAVSTARASGADPKLINTKFYFEPIRLQDHTLGEMLDKQDLPRMNNLLESAGYSFIINELTEALMNGIHNEISTILATDANFSAGNSVYNVNGSSVEWQNTATAVPRTDVKELKSLYRAAQGAEPNYGVISRDVLDILILTDEWINYWDKIPMPESEIEQLKKYFSVPNFLILDKYKGINGSFTSYYDEIFLLTYIEPAQRGELIGNIVANRSALRVYFLDQNSAYNQDSDPSVEREWMAMNVGLPMLMKFWMKWDQYAIKKNIIGNVNYKVHVANQYAMAKLKNIYT